MPGMFASFSKCCRIYAAHSTPTRRSRVLIVISSWD
jgi:hypothetical protein